MTRNFQRIGRGWKGSKDLVLVTQQPGEESLAHGAAEVSRGLRFHCAGAHLICASRCWAQFHRTWHAEQAGFKWPKQNLSVMVIFKTIVALKICVWCQRDFEFLGFSHLCRNNNWRTEELQIRGSETKVFTWSFIQLHGPCKLYL